VQWRAPGGNRRQIGAPAAYTRTMDTPPPVVAVINSSPDTVDLLRIAMESHGFVVVSGLTHAIRDGVEDFEALLRQHNPSVIVYDIAPPYDANWRLMTHLRSSPMLDGRPFVITSTNAARVREIAGADEPVYEIIGKPYDLNRIIEAVETMLRSR
jgi:CheY-like chemotaxis protein